MLGFTVKARDRVERSSLGVPIDLVYLDLGGTVVELISYEGIVVDPASQTEHLKYRMIALEVDDMQRTADYLRTKGVDIVWGPRVRETYSRAETRDPNGYHIELRQWFRQACGRGSVQDPLQRSTYIYKTAAGGFVGWTIYFRIMHCNSWIKIFYTAEGEDSNPRSRAGS